MRCDSCYIMNGGRKLGGYKSKADSGYGDGYTPSTWKKEGLRCEG